MSKTFKSWFFVGVSLLAAIACVISVGKAEIERQNIYDRLVRDGFTGSLPQKYPMLLEEFLAIAFFLLTTSTLVYGIWLRKTRSVDNNSSN